MGILSIIIGVGKIIGIIVGVLLGVAYVTIAERKYMSSIQRRRGPNVVGMYGMLQPFGDGLKLLLKETVMPTSANWVVFMCAPGITFTLALMSWAVIPIGIGKVYSDINIGVMYIMGISALGVYGIIMAGWASNSKYAFMGAMRSTAQMISYEVSIGFTLVTCMLCAGTMNMTGIVWGQERVWNMIPLMPIMLIFVISILAETNRHPFDLPEAEAELVSGYNVEYSGAGFALFFLGEYGNMIMMSGLTVILFMGGWMMPFKEAWGGPVVFGVKTLLMICVYIWARAAFPRYRYDQLMGVGWKVLLPLAMGWVVITAGVLHIM